MAKTDKMGSTGSLVKTARTEKMAKMDREVNKVQVYLTKHNN